MMPVARRYFRDGLPLSITIWGPSGRKRYVHGPLWNAVQTGFAVPMRNLYTASPWDSFIPRSLFPEDPYRWGGFTLVFCKHQEYLTLVDIMGSPPFWSTVVKYGDSGELDRFVQTLLVTWPRAIATQIHRADRALAVMQSPVIVAQPRGGAWLAALIARARLSRSGKHLNIVHLSTEGLALPPELSDHRLAFVDDTLGTGSTLFSACTALGRAPDVVFTAGATYDPAHYRNIVGRDTLFRIPALDRNPTAFRIVENCPELMGWDYNRCGRLARAPTLLSSLLDRTLLTYPDTPSMSPRS